MSSLEPVPGTIAKVESGTYQYGSDHSYKEHPSEPPAVRKLWTRVRWLFVLNIGLALATGFQAYFAYRNNELTRVSLEDTRKATEAAISVARITENQLVLQLGQMDLARDQMIAGNKTATEQLASQRAALQLDQRAWISVTQFRLDREIADGAVVNIITSITNTGRTPALNVSIRSQAYLSIRTPTVDLRTFPTTNRSIIFPNMAGASVTTPAGPVINGATAMYAAKTARVYLLMLIEYDDVFGRPHWAEVCAVHESGMPLGSFNHCPSGNGIDNN